MRVLFFSLFILISNFLYSQSIELVADKWPPFQYAESDGSLSGFSIELVRNVLDMMDLEYSINLVPYTRLHHQLRSGISDGGFLVTETEERKRYLWYSDEPVYRLRHVYFVRKNEKIKILKNSYNDLIGYRIGLTRDYQYPDDFLEFLEQKKIKSEYVVNDEQNFKKLYSGRLDVVVADIKNGLSIIKENSYDEKIIPLEDYVLAEYDLFMVWSRVKRDRKLADLFSEKLRLFKKTGEYKRILNKYFGS